HAGIYCYSLSSGLFAERHLAGIRAKFVFYLLHGVPGIEIFYRYPLRSFASHPEQQAGARRRSEALENDAVAVQQVNYRVGQPRQHGNIPEQDIRSFRTLDTSISPDDHIMELYITDMHLR